MIRRAFQALPDGMFRRDLTDGRLTTSDIDDALTELNLRRGDMRKLGDYYIGQNPAILHRKRTEGSAGAPDNRIASPMARKLINTVTGYMYRPGYIQYGVDDNTQDEYKDRLAKVFSANGEASKTARAGKYSSIFGAAYEVHYTRNNGTPEPRFTLLPTEDFLPVYSNDVEPEIVAGVHRYYEEVTGRSTGIEHIDVYYADTVISYSSEGAIRAGTMLVDDEAPHGYGMVPIVVYNNNDESMGDYEHVLGLIDAYDVLMSDSMNEFDRFAWAYLVLKDLNMDEDALNDVKLKRVFEVLKDGSVEFLTKDIQTQFISFMRDWIQEEIHKQTHIPDMTDEHFAGNQSGVAIRYKLTDLENIAAVKEIGFREGLQRRIALLNSFWMTQGLQVVPPEDVSITMNRNVPANYKEQAEIMSMLRGHVSHRTLLDEVITFVSDAGHELDEINREVEAMPAFDLGVEDADGDA